MFGKVEGKNKKIFHFEDTSSKDVNENIVGRKGLSLFKLQDIDIPIPDFFVISSEVISDLIEDAFIDNAEKLLANEKNPEGKELKSVILKESFDVDFQEELLKQYTRISGFTDAWVSVRSSVVFPSKEKVSFSGVFDTKLNIRGFDDLKDAIKQVIASVYTDNTLAYCVKEGVDLADVRLSIVVQKMIQAEVSGVAFTVDPITQDRNRMSIEAIFGLGDVIATGELTPDSYVLNKKDLTVIEKHIAPQEWMKVRTLGKKSLDSSEDKIRISHNWSHKQKLEDKYMDEVAKISLIIEANEKKSQDVEWVLGGGKVWVLQSKDEGWEKSVSEEPVYTFENETLGEVVRRMVSKTKSLATLNTRTMEDAKRFVQAHSKKKVEKKSVLKSKDRGLEFLMSGIGASVGVIVGRVKVVPFPIPQNFEIDSNDILVISTVSEEVEKVLSKASGFILETGGLTADPAIMAREMKIPAVVGASIITDLVKDGDIVQIDGNVGSIYRVKGVELPKEAKIVIAKPKMEIKEVPKKIKEEAIEVKETLDLPPTATKVYISDAFDKKGVSENVKHSSGVVFIDLDELMIKEKRHPLAYVNEKKFKDYSMKLAQMIDTVADEANANEVIVSIGSKSVKDFRGLVKGKVYENTEALEGLMGASRLVGNVEVFRVALRVIKRVRNIHRDRNVSIAIHSPMNGSVMKEVKKEISAIGLRRSTTFNVFAIIDNPGEVIVTDDILDADIDGLIFNSVRIAKSMQGVPLDGDSVYMLDSGSVLKAVEGVKEATRAHEKRLIVMGDDNEEYIKYCVKLGVYGVSVTSEKFIDMKQLVADEEAKVIMSVG